MTRSADRPLDGPISVGVVGVGRMGSLHARTYRRLPQAELVGVFDVDPVRAAEVAGATGCKCFASLGELAARVRAASVAVPTSLHAAVGIELLGHGVDLLVEKPLAGTTTDGQALVAAAAAADAILMVGHTERFNPVIRAIASMIDRPGFVEVHRLAPFSPRGTDVDVVLDLMIHDLDLLLHFVDSEVVQVDAVGVPVVTATTDIANARIRFASGTVANLTASRVSVERLRKVRFFEPDLYISLDTGKRTAKAYRLVRGDDPRAAPRIEAVDLGTPPDQDPVEAELAAFVAAVQTREAPAVSGAQGLAAMVLAERVRTAIEVNVGRG